MTTNVRQSIAASISPDLVRDACEEAKARSAGRSCVPRPLGPLAEEGRLPGWLIPRPDHASPAGDPYSHALQPGKSIGMAPLEASQPDNGSDRVGHVCPTFGSRRGP